MVKAMMQEKKIAEIARRQVATALREILSDPDASLALQKKTVLRLRGSLRSKKGGRVKDLADVLRTYK
ncbi:MAG: hypothetical protein WAP51_02480 [Candidatus Sungiibacteriota bacterium]